MRIRITHATTYTYATPVRAMTQMLRVTPRPYDGQQVIQWRLTADADVRLRWSEDAFGNIVHCLSIERPVDRLCVSVVGEIATADTAGVVGGAIERLPTSIYLRATERTRADAALTDLALSADPGAVAGELVRAHALMGAVADAVAFEVGATEVATSAADALKIGRGVCQDLAHVFIAAARALGLPTRYVSGHLLRADGIELQEAAHAWAEVHVAGLGWVGFDPTNRICPTDAYVRVATGLDYLDAAPVRGAREGGGLETMRVALTVAPVRGQMQNQGNGWQSQSQGNLSRLNGTHRPGQSQSQGAFAQQSQSQQAMR